MKISKVILFEVPFYSDYKDVLLPPKNATHTQQDYMTDLIETLYSNYRYEEIDLAEERSINFGLSVSINVPYDYYGLRNYNYCFIASNLKFISFFCRPTAENNSIGNTTLLLTYDHFINNIHYLYNGNYYKKMFTTSRTMGVFVTNPSFETGLSFDKDIYFTNEGEPVVTVEDLIPHNGVDILYYRIQMANTYVALEVNGDFSYSELLPTNSQNQSTPYTQNFKYGNSTYLFIPYKVYRKNTLEDITDNVILYCKDTLGGITNHTFALNENYIFNSTDIIKVDFTFYPPFGVSPGQSYNEYIIDAQLGLAFDTQYKPVFGFTDDPSMVASYCVVSKDNEEEPYTHIVEHYRSGFELEVPYYKTDLQSNGEITDEMKLNTNLALKGGTFYNYKLYTKMNTLPLPELTLASDYTMYITPREGGNYVKIEGFAGFNQSQTPLATMDKSFSTFFVMPSGELLTRTSQYDVFMRNNANYFSANYNYKQFKNLMDQQKAGLALFSGVKSVISGVGELAAGAATTAVIPTTALVTASSSFDAGQKISAGVTQAKSALLEMKESIQTAVWDKKMHVAQIQDLKNSRDNLDIPNVDANGDIYLQDRILIVRERFENPYSSYEGVLIVPEISLICDKVQFFGYNINMTYDILKRNGKCFDYVQTSKSEFQFAPPLSKFALEAIFNNGVRIWHTDELLEYNKSLNPNIKNFYWED